MAITGFLFLGSMFLLILLVILAYFVNPYSETAAKAIFYVFFGLLGILMVALPITAISEFIVLLLF